MVLAMSLDYCRVVYSLLALYLFRQCGCGCLLTDVSPGCVAHSDEESKYSMTPVEGRQRVSAVVQRRLHCLYYCTVLSV